MTVVLWLRDCKAIETPENGITVSFMYGDNSGLNLQENFGLKKEKLTKAGLLYINISQYSELTNRIVHDTKAQADKTLV